MTNYKPVSSISTDFPRQDPNVVNEWDKKRKQPTTGIQQPAHVYVPMPEYPPASPGQGRRWSSDQPDVAKRPEYNETPRTDRRSRWDFDN